MTDGPSLRTALCDMLGCRYPILQAGMGGVARADLVTAVSNAGGYGFLGMVRESPERISCEIAAVRNATDRPFGVNLIPAATDPSLLNEELAVCLAEGVHSLCFFWDVDREAVARAKDAGCLVFYQVGSVADAVAAQDAGADVIIAQGSEAGGHVRGSISSLVLLPQIVRAVSVPVVASGGFGSGASLVAALALGAQGMHCGTVFLATEESYAHTYHKDRVVAAASEDTVYTDVFAINWPSNAPVRVIGNSITAALDGNFLGHKRGDFPHEVIADEEGRPIYRYSTDSPLKSMNGDLEPLALFAGQVVGSIESIVGAGERIAAMVEDARAALLRIQHAFDG